MTLEELEREYRDAIDILGNQLQNTLLGLSQTETRLTQIGESVNNLTRIIEEFIQQQRQSESE
ncbi:hypothetical protein [Coleofasciculus chthonoplastes]|jgi:hypothetical protein|uniref:Uncharacterized protein n=1 Tax=Coleofasciculus chthonoplastes PCC 7420 TaxID=118168 RepID=B4VI14_9CYAN|nr:hypothetical protein [Coleofasciculus chthonoplastes]EDX78350.1 hypothetical protein MC7420_7003 [Coleofasciculus chthonoplastes PCC 7420]